MSRRQALCLPLLFCALLFAPNSSFAEDKDSVHASLLLRCRLLFSDAFYAVKNIRYKAEDGKKYLRPSALPMAIQNFNQSLWPYWRVFQHRTLPEEALTFFAPRPFPSKNSENFKVF